MSPRAEFRERYYERQGIGLEIRVRSRGDRFRVAVALNGCEEPPVSRPTLRTALAWGRWRAEEILGEFGLGAIQLGLLEAEAS